LIKGSAVIGYARFVGRVGALAVALGVGIAVAGNPAAAWADTDADNTSNDTSESSNDTARTPNETGTDAEGQPVVVGPHEVVARVAEDNEGFV
jgi:hypothetical protein